MPYNSNNLINGLDAETTIADTDELVFGDVSDSNRAKKITFSNLKTEIVGDDTAFVRKSDYDANSILYATTDILNSLKFFTGGLPESDALLNTIDCLALIWL